jgi:hypothetical protein
VNRRRVLRLVAPSFLALSLLPGSVLAAEPMAAPEGFAEVRARFENLTPSEVKAAGYIADPPVCVAAPDGSGAMGIHALNRQLLGMQFPAGTMDPENPPVLLLSADGHRVVGLEWEAKDIGQGEFELYGQAVVLQDAHPGVPEPHYMLHAYFRPNGEVLFAPFDPQLSCELPDTSIAGGPAAPFGTPIVALMAGLVGGLGWLVLRRNRSTRNA